MNSDKKTIFSGVQPSGTLHIGNYLGALLQWVEMQEKYNSIFCVVDYHAITVKQDPEKLKKQILNVVKVYLASGIDPKKSTIFLQSQISAHTELAWILNTITKTGELNKMTQFKDKAGKNQESVGVGLYDYPVLMAADILLYNTDIVPVGEDQVQHVELARDLAKRFNNTYGDVFRLPEAQLKKEGARIMGLDDPMKKMSKSAPTPANYIALTDSPEIATKKIMRAVTDSGAEIEFDKKDKPAISNLLNIYSLLSGKSIKEVEKVYKDKGYGDFKKGLAQVVSLFLVEFQKEYNKYSDDDVRAILEEGAKKVHPIADESLRKVKEKLGVIL